MAKHDIGQCETCGENFTYQLIHNGLNESAFAYCNRCGCTALLTNILMRRRSGSWMR